MHHTVFQTTLTSTKNVQKKVEEETCILILEFHVSLIMFCWCEVLFSENYLILPVFHARNPKQPLEMFFETL